MKSFLLIGQSNMAGRGVLESVPKLSNDKIFMFRDGEWLPMEEPLHRDKPEAGIGLSPAFADEFVKKTSEVVGLIPCAVGGTALSQWMPGEELYQNAVHVAKKAQETSTLAGVLWHQGEGDITNAELAKSYKERFMLMINTLKAELGISDVPVIVGELGEFLAKGEGHSHLETVNCALRDIAATKNFAIALAKGLVDKGDTLHFDAASLREFGKRYFEAYLKIKLL